MANDERLIPTYVEGDFATMLNKFKDLLSQNDTFKDYNYEGSNMAMIIEMLSYMGDFTNFYTNLVAKNVYIDTANVYETVHRLVTQKGYIPLGWLSSEVTVNVSLSADTIFAGDWIVIPAWQTVTTGLTTDNGDSISYTLTYQFKEKAVVDGSIDFTIQMRQGTIDTLSYTGEDLVDHQIVLPFRDYDIGMYPYDIQSLQVSIQDQEWIRVHDFYDHISGLIPDERTVYSFLYDKYKRYALSFASSQDVPNNSDTITLNLLRSLGTDGIIAQDTFTVDSLGISELSIYNASRNQPPPNELERIVYTQDNIISFTNPDASVGGSDPETVTELKANANANMHTQFRNVTGVDYKFHQEMRSDVVKATAWGEQEVDPGNTIEYNKVYVSCIPRKGNTSMFMDGTLNTTNVVWEESEVPGLSATIEIPTTYTDAFINDLLQYLEPRKMISVYEFPTVPDSIYFRYDIGLRTNRAYDYIDVANDVRDKLNYFFNPINREYHEEVNFMDIHNFIFDLAIIQDDNLFLNIKGLDNLVIREQSTYTNSLSGSDPQHVYEPNTINNFPQYSQEAKEGYTDNKLRPIQLGYNQFPMISIDMCRFVDEGD